MYNAPTHDSSVIVFHIAVASFCSLENVFHVVVSRRVWR